MIKRLLIVLLLSHSFAQAQIFRLTYNATICPSQLNATTGVYLYAGANISSPGAAPTYFADANIANLYPLYQTQTGIWEICFNPYQIFRDGNNSLIPQGATIYSFDINFRNTSASIFTGNCSDAAIRIDNPLTNPNSSAPAIANGLVVPTCNVGLPEIQNNTIFLTHSANPLKTKTVFHLNVPGKSKVSVELYNVLGKKVYSLINNKELSGYYEYSWNGTDDEGNLLANGCYFYTLKSDNRLISANKLIISR